MRQELRNIDQGANVVVREPGRAPKPRRLLLADLAPEKRRPLTPREIECLQWTAKGKTAWEVSVILGISEQTAAKHLHNASRKLGCVSKYQATLIAMRLGVLDGSALTLTPESKPGDAASGPSER